MLERIDHIGIAVTHLDEAVDFYRMVMGLEVSATEAFNGMKIAFLRVSDSELELLEDTTPDTRPARKGSSSSSSSPTPLPPPEFLPWAIRSRMPGQRLTAPRRRNNPSLVVREPCIHPACRHCRTPARDRAPDGPAHGRRRA
jgi:catechol 2,3-dioxygenase-like lactoylglutathione lyase family enzyme